VMSAIVFPQPLEDLLQHTAQTRLQHFLRNTLRVLQGGVPRADWIALHLEGIQETLQLDSYRSGALFESKRGRSKNIRVREMIANMMFASGSLHLLNSHIRRLRRDTLAPVRIKTENLIDSIRLDFQEIQQQLQNSEIPKAENHLQVLQNRTEQQLDELRVSLQDELNYDQRLALDSLILLLTRFLAELRRYVVSYGQLICPETIKTIPPLPLTIARVQGKHWHTSFDRPPTEIAQPLSAALRSMVVVAVVSLFWLNTAWPSGPEAVIFAVVLSALFSTFPNPLASVRQMGFGVLLAFLAALLFSLEFLPRISGFPMLALALLPFLLIPPWLLTRTRWSGTAAGFGIFFPLFAIPGEGQEISYTALLNNGIAQLLAVFIVGIAFYLIFPVGNSWERERILKRFRGLVRVAAQAPLFNLRNQFQAESREYLRLLAADLSPHQASDLKILHEAMRLDDLAEGILQLRILLHAQAEMEGEQPLQRYEAQYVTPLFDAFPQKYVMPMSANYEERLCAVIDAAASLPTENVDKTLHPILPPDALFRVYVHVIASVSRRLSIEKEAEHAR
ncbi:FUSC family protein, partial [Acidithiobacillus albertensis]